MNDCVVNDLYILCINKYDSADNEQWANTYEPINFTFWSTSKSIVQTPANGYIVPANRFQLYGEHANAWLLKLNPSGSYQ